MPYLTVDLTPENKPEAESPNTTPPKMAIAETPDKMVAVATPNSTDTNGAYLDDSPATLAT